jgi:hypothetical protein
MGRKADGSDYRPFSLGRFLDTVRCSVCPTSVATAATEPSRCVWRPMYRRIAGSETTMGLFFYFVLFVVMCFFGWSVRGTG